MKESGILLLREFSSSDVDTNSVCLQLVREFNLVGVDLKFDSNEAAFINEVVQYINDWINSDQEKLWALLYRADIEEQHVSAAISNSKNRSTALVITKLLITKCVQKIRSRYRYS